MMCSYRTRALVTIVGSRFHLKPSFEFRGCLCIDVSLVTYWLENEKKAKRALNIRLGNEDEMFLICVVFKK